MRKRLLCLAVLALCLSAAIHRSASGAEAEAPDILQQERIGRLHIGVPASQAGTQIPCETERGPQALEAATGEVRSIFLRAAAE